MQAAEQSRTLLALGLGLTAAAANVLGGSFIVRRDWSRLYLKYFLALGAGFMLAAAFLEVIPEAIRLAGNRALLLVLVGYFIVHFFEHTMAPHFHFGEETHVAEMASLHAGYTALLGLMIHTFFDGVAIASGFLVSAWLGGVIFLAVFLHKLPEGFTVASLMLASGQSRRIAFLASVMLGAATLAGVLLMNVLRGGVSYALPISAGVTVYVAASDLMPEVNREPGVRMALVVFLGVALMFLLHHFFHI
ncbi:MAG: ZIP family metal transporter [Acidobacteria bacterium]|nr:ZIP family metal transporter [Acidobacteriota bacterium]